MASSRNIPRLPRHAVNVALSPTESDDDRPPLAEACCWRRNRLVVVERHRRGELVCAKRDAGVVAMVFVAQDAEEGLALTVLQFGMSLSAA